VEVHKLQGAGFYKLRKENSILLRSPAVNDDLAPFEINIHTTGKAG
jgi:hypothetical protein